MTPKTESPDGGTPESKTPAPPVQRRRGLHVVAIIVAVCALIALALTYVPSHVVRSLLADELQALGIDAAGIETLEVDVWASEVWVGPVEFRVGTAQPAQLVELGLAYDPGALFQRRFVVDRLIVRGLDVRIERAADGAFSINGVPLVRLLPAAEGAEPVDAGAEEGAGWHVGLLDLQLRDAHVALRDGSVEPAVGSDVRFKELEVRGIDTADPDRSMRVHLLGTINEFAEVGIDGAIAPLKEEPDFDLTASLRNVELHPLSPYAERMFGTRLDSGRLTVEAAGKADAGTLEGQADIDLLGVAFEPLSAEDAQRLSENVGAPIETVVGLLEDDEGRIKLTLPVGGTVAEPEVDLSEAIGKAVGGVLSQLFPPTAIAGMLSDLGSGGGLFPPVVFAPNSDALDEAGRADTDDVVALLNERPKLSIRVCGRATKADLDAHVAAVIEQAAKDLSGAKAPAEAKPGKDAKEAELATALPEPERIARDAESAMHELAAKRTVAFRRYLADGRGIAAERVSECRPAFDPADTGLPRVEVRL